MTYSSKDTSIKLKLSEAEMCEINQSISFDTIFNTYLFLPPISTVALCVPV